MGVQGAEPSLPEKFFISARKTAMLTCKIPLPDSPHTTIISKNPGFRALYLARRNELRCFRLINTKKIYFSFLAADFRPKNLAFVRKIRKIMALQPLPPAPLASTPMHV